MEGYHRSVLVEEVNKALDIKEGSWYVDATLGDGGHSLKILELGGKVLGIDQDYEAIKRSKERFDGVGIREENYKLRQGNFSNLGSLREQTDIKGQIKGVLFDLGVSSLQIGDPKRGFSFLQEGPLDMRMDLDLEVKAQDLINGLNKEELNELFYKLGEEKFSKRIADTIVRARKVRKIETTRQLADLIEREIGRREKIHPATRVFQALRIAINDELNVLKVGLKEALRVLDKGVIVVISFHSLEDRIVKTTFKDWQEKGLGEGNKEIIRPNEDEIRINPRSRSAKLRIFKKL